MMFKFREDNLLFMSFYRSDMSILKSSLQKTTRLTLNISRSCSVVSSSSAKSVIDETAGKQFLEQYIEADYPHKITGLHKLLQNTTVLYPNKVPLYSTGLHKWRPGCGTLRVWHQVFGEDTLSRFDQNSKVIVIDGPKFAGKTKLAKDLAKGLNMRYFPKVTETWAQEVGFDGEIDADWKWNMFTSMQKFYEDPKSACGHSARLQFVIFFNSFRQYINNLLHLLGTGQGVVMEKSVFNNWADKDALLEMDYITPRFHAWLGARERFLLDTLLPPHLLIYLDVSPEETYKRVQEFGNAYEKKVDKKYLESVDKFNKFHLPELNKRFNTVTVQYDWNKRGNSEQVLDDFELLDFSGIKWWEKYNTNDMYEMRVNYQNKAMIEADWLSLGPNQPEIAFSPLYAEQFEFDLYKKGEKKKMLRRDWLDPVFVE